jgi:hypothetical protein
VSLSSIAARASTITGLIAALAIAPSALAGKGGGSKPSGGSCVRKAPAVYIDNTYDWAAYGSWGLPGQKLTYSVHVVNYDAGCGTSSFSLSVSAPTGFTTSVPTTAISLKSGSDGYLSVYVTSPSSSADGDYPLTFSLQRTGTAGTAGSATSWFKVYSSDTTAPTLYWGTPGDGSTISGRSFNVGVEASDDHAVKSIEIYIDGVLKLNWACDDIAYGCDAIYAWSTRAGSHTVTFIAHDWLGNASSLTNQFTVG